ncbi:MAG: HAMP domain-containing histidine kinase, partial [Eubacterium sp.]|nr:HAMP domain-containing histidine kinase [Eubacterium sp.]
SHDLKTPLTSVINYVDLLKGCDIEDKKAKEYIVVLDEQGKKLKRLIDDLIEASKITSGVINIELININLSELATQAVVEHQQEFSNNGLELVFKGDKKNISAFADGSKTYRIIENLISNARKYSLKGTRVYSDVYETENYSIFEIKNTSAEQLDISVNELKERFVRGDKSRTNEGNGLGLSIADNLCKAQGGHLNITIDGDLFKVQVMLPKAKN